MSDCDYDEWLSEKSKIIEAVKVIDLFPIPILSQSNPVRISFYSLFSQIVKISFYSLFPQIVKILWI